MANVKVAIRVRPLNAREGVDGGRLAVQVEDKLVRIKNTKLDGRQDVHGDSREKVLEFGFDYCYWSVSPEEPHYASQEEVFQDLGVSVLAGASEGYNVCLFAYGQTGTGKTYTMMGTQDSMGLTPRICQGLFRSDATFPEGQNSSRVEISFLEIYNERVRDLLRGRERKKKDSLRVREHPEKGPYVQDLSQHVVSDYKQAVELLEEGIANRITAATHIHDASSRSHAIFTIQYTQAILENNLPSEIVSKIHLVDLAGSERADPHYCRDRLTEGSNINKSLVTLGIVISALAQNSQMSSSCQSINSVASEGDAGSTVGSHTSSLSGGGGGGGGGGGRRHCFIPYRDSVLTWLLKDSLGGNSKTIMIATVSPSCRSYNETLSTLRYAAHARNIVNKPRVNEDASVRLIRELREEIDRLKSMLLSFEMQRNPSPSLSDERDGSLSDMVLQNELKVDQLTKDWSESWRDKKELLEQYSVDINRDRAGFLIHSLLPHLITLDRDVLSTGVTFYHLREGVTTIGPQDKLVEPQIVLQGGATCEIENQSGVVTLRPLPGSVCMVNDREVTEPCRLAQGSVITIGGVHKFRFNHPAEAAVLRERRRASEGALNCSYSDLRSLTSDPRLGGEVVLGQTGYCVAEGEDPASKPQCVEDQVKYVEERRGYVECLRQEIQTEQRRAERDLESEQAHLRQQHIDIQQWILQEKQRLAAITLEEKGTQEFGVQTDPIPAPILDSLLTEGSEGSEEGCGQTVAPPSKVVLNRKKVVQEELLRYHALRRAETRFRRKRLHYQLERIARKRHLLEAKRELQQLEKALPPGLESPASPELVSSSSSRGLQPVLRRHSFSSDLLSRLYPQHTPIFSHFLKRNRPSELTFGSINSRQWVSDECLPRERTRSHSNTFSSGTGPSSQEQGWRSRTSSSENLKLPVKDEEEALAHPPCRERPERKPLLPKRGLEFTFKNNQNPSQSQNGGTLQSSSNAIVKEPTVTVSKSSSQTQKAQCKAVKSLPRGSRKGLETIRKVLSHSISPGLKTALARVFRKPPSGLSRRTTPTGKTASRFHWKQNRGVEEANMSRKKCTMKTTVSCEDLDQKTPLHDCRQRQRRWHSAETLINQTSILRWVQRPQGLAGWEEYDSEEEEEREGDHSSDCDSLFSMDSLSSAYATALAEQLKQEEAIQSEAESEDSQMSKDSLAMESRGKHVVSRLAQRWTGEVPSHSVARGLNPSIEKTMNMASDIQQTREGIEDIGKPNEMPAEVYWSHHGGPKTGVNEATGTTKESRYQKQSAQEPRCRDTVSKLSEELGHIHAMLTGSPRSLSSCSVREPESLLALTDAWSSTDAADSPRIPRDSAVLRRRMVFSHGALDSSSCPSPVSADLSDSLSVFGSTESHSSASTDGTEGEQVTVEEQRLGVSGGTTDTLNLHNSQLLQTAAPHIMIPLIQEPVCCEDYLKRQTVSTEGLLKVSIDDPGFCNNQNGDVSSEIPSHRSAFSPTIDYKTQCIPSTLEAAMFHGHQMQQETLPKPEGGMLNETLDIESAPKNPSGDNDLFNVDGDMEEVRVEEFCEASNTKDTSTKSEFKLLQNLGAKVTEQNCLSPEQESFKASCKNPRKRNKVLQDSFTGSLKIPKRSNEGDFCTFSTVKNSQEVIWSDDKNNTSELKDKPTSFAVDSFKLNLGCNEDNFQRDTSAMSVSVHISQEHFSPCDHKTIETDGHKGTPFGESAVIIKTREVNQGEEIEVQRQGEKLISDGKRRDVENGRWGPHHGDSNCSPIDQRISEVVKEHMRMSGIDGDGDNSNSELESQSSQSLNALPTSNPNKCDSPKDLQIVSNHQVAAPLRSIKPVSCSTSEKSLICSEKLKMDNMTDMENLSHEKVLRHSTSLIFISMKQSSFITKDNDSDGTTKIPSESQLSQSIRKKVREVQLKHGITDVDKGLDASGCAVIASNDQASVNSGAASFIVKSHEIKLSLALNNQGQPEYINKPVLLPMGHSSGSTFTTTIPKECLVCQGKRLERDVPFQHMGNIKKQTGPDKYHPHLNCLGSNDKQTVNQAGSSQQTLKHSALQPLQNCQGTMSSVTTPPNKAFAHLRDIIMDSEVQGKNKNQCKLISPTGAGGQLDLKDRDRHAAVDSLSNKGRLQRTPEDIDKHHNSQIRSNNPQSVDAIKTLTVSLHCDILCESQKLEEKEVRKEFQKDTPYATNRSKELPQSKCSSETQVDTFHNTCVTVDPDPKNKHPTVKHNKCHIEKWLKAQCNVRNFASDNAKGCQMANNEEGSMTEKPRTKSPVSSFDVPSEMNSNGSSTSQITQGSSDANMKILGDICGDIMSRKGNNKTSNFRQPHQFSGSSVVHCKKGTSKRFRRSKVQAPPSSSSDSTLKSSSDEEQKIIPRLHRSRSSSTRMKPESQTHGNLEVSQCNGAEIPPVKRQSPQSKDNHNMEACTVPTPAEYDDKAGVGISLGKKEHSLNGQSAHTLAMEKRTIREKIMASSIKENMMSHYTPKPQDSPMHFASSDVNPFVHQWQEEEPNQRCYKNQVFGSAADISCKSPMLDSTDKRITRCCSVDNGLNVQNSPFNSHLSTYANNKGLSSTLSSMEEDLKGQTSPKAHLKECTNQASSIDDHNQPLIRTMSCNSSSCHDVSGDPGNSSGQVDEIMLVYSSEQESQSKGFQCPETHTTCDHSTQTTMTQETMTKTTINHSDLQRRNNHHRLSSTQVPVLQKNTEASRKTTTWASLQNMSEHLSQLIHNTSDLLGNVQGMRSGDSLRHSPIRNVKYSSHLYSSRDWTKRDCSTQTAVDIGIQTERTSTTIQDKMFIHQTLSTERSKAHEVNVIVKVIGSEVLNVSQEKELPLQHQLKNRPDDRIQSIPDLRLNGSTVNQRYILEPESVPHKVPSLETVVQCHSHSNPAVHCRSNEDCKPERVSFSKSLGVSEVCNNLSEILRPESRNILRRSDPGIGCIKQASSTDRACSPILTVSPRAGSNQSSRTSLQSLKEQQKFEMQNRSKEHISPRKECQSTPCLNFSEQKTCVSFTKNDKLSGHDSLHLCEKPCDMSTTKSTGSISLENVSALSNSSPKGSDGCSESLSSSIDKYIHKETRIVSHEEEGEMSTWHKTSQSPRCSLPSVLSSNGVTLLNHTSLTFRQTDVSKKEEKSISSFGDQLSHRRHSIDYHHCRPSEGPVECFSGAYDHSPLSDNTVQVQEDDMVSLAPSECNTDVLVNINPVTHTSNFQHSPQQRDCQCLPEDLPVHNKFTNWSGISQHPSDRGQISSSIKPAIYLPTGHKAQRNQPEWTSLSPESTFQKIRKTREIERLRKEREQVMATVQLNMNPHQLTVELTEAKLHYGLGETDMLLKILTSGGTKEEEPSAVPTKQQLYERHRSSIEGLRQERDTRLQNCRRARSLSPSKHNYPHSPPQSRSPSHLRSPPQKAISSSRVSTLPSQRRECLQHLRQEEMEGSRIPDPPRGEGHYPSEIEQLLRDYGRAREEARTEIAHARERLRERTEQEKRRLQQQALSQVVKDDLRYRTRVSSSTLCTGSSLSLSSGPTSGYNSGNTAQLRDGSRPSLTQEVTGVPDNGINGLKVRSRPPICGSQSVTTQRAWLSAQDVRLEPGVSGSDPLMSSSPSSPTSLRPRTASFGSASSLSTAYQDLTSCLLGRAMAEVRLAAAGDMGNLVRGKAAAGWRYQGLERGVQAFYKPSSSPSVHSFLGAVELERPLASLWSMVRDHSKTHLYHKAIHSARTRPLDDSTQLVYLLTDPSCCHLKQPRDFCCISTQSRQDDLCVLAVQSVFEESLPRPSVEAIRGEMLPSAWVLQPITRHGREVVRVIYLLQVDLGTPSFPQRLLGTVARRQAAVLAELDSLFSL
uniref:StAR-related lipid transfer protein 9 n=1 Tax=Oncorhynchus tshawytscha TaxID=74940 RepID=A0A8C8ERI4_ONCTS